MIVQMPANSATTHALPKIGSEAHAAVPSVCSTRRMCATRETLSVDGERNAGYQCGMHGAVRKCT